MKRKYRILRIWLFGRLSYAKRVSQWMKWQFWRDMNTSGIMDDIAKKYSGKTKFFWWEEGCEIKDTSETSATVGETVTIQITKDNS